MGTKFLQVNLGRGRDATDAMRQYVTERGVDVVMVSEPYVHETEWMGFKKFGKDNGKAEVWVREGVKGWEISSETDENVVKVNVKLGGKAMVVVAVYDEPGGRTNERVRGRMAEWGRHKGPTIVAGDFNAKHEAWGGIITDPRGEELLELAIMFGWELANDSGQGPTFESVNGRSWVDVTWTRGV